MMRTITRFFVCIRLKLAVLWVIVSTTTISYSIFKSYALSDSITNFLTLFNCFISILNDIVTIHTALFMFFVEISLGHNLTRLSVVNNQFRLDLGITWMIDKLLVTINTTTCTNSYFMSFFTDWNCHTNTLTLLTALTVRHCICADIFWFTSAFVIIAFALTPNTTKV